MTTHSLIRISNLENLFSMLMNWHFQGKEKILVVPGCNRLIFSLIIVLTQVRDYLIITTDHQKAWASINWEQEMNKAIALWATTKQKRNKQGTNSTWTKRLCHNLILPGQGITALNHLLGHYLFQHTGRIEIIILNTNNSRCRLVDKVTLASCIKIRWGKCRGLRKISEIITTTLTVWINHQLQ